MLVQSTILIYWYQIKEKYKKGTENKNEKTYKCITANTSAMEQHAAHTTYQLSSPSPSWNKVKIIKPRMNWYTSVKAVIIRSSKDLT